MTWRVTSTYDVCVPAAGDMEGRWHTIHASHLHLGQLPYRPLLQCAPRADAVPQAHQTLAPRPAPQVPCNPLRHMLCVSCMTHMPCVCCQAATPSLYVHEASLTLNRIGQQPSHPHHRNASAADTLPQINGRSICEQQTHKPTECTLRQLMEHGHVQSWWAAPLHPAGWGDGRG